MSAVELGSRRPVPPFRRGVPGPERQLTLRHAVEWSYDLLTEDERKLVSPELLRSSLVAST